MFCDGRRKSGENSELSKMRVLRLRALFDHISISNTLYRIVPCITLVEFIEGGSLVVDWAVH